MDWDTRAYLRHVPTVFEAVRHEFGPELVLLDDGHHRMTPIQAAKLGKALEAVRVSGVRKFLSSVLAERRGSLIPAR